MNQIELKLKSSWGHKVRDYIEFDPSNPCTCKWKYFNFLQVPSQIKAFLKLELDKRHVFLSNKQDEIIWIKSKSGEYNVKDGYASLANVNHRIYVPLKFCWGPHVLPKAGPFSWLAIKDRILTGTRLDRLGIINLFPCVMCGKTFESTNHLLPSCDFAQICWYWLLNQLGWSSPLYHSLYLHFLS